MLQHSEEIELAKKYLRQQAELYGREFYLELPTMAESPTSLNEFYQAIKDCQKCDLSESRTTFVFGTGNPDANLMCIGEAPGREEDQRGEPFVGKAGELLNRILGAIGFERDEVYIANIVKCRPPQNRDPKPEEANTCLPYLKQQIAMIQPKLILLLGRIAAQYVLQRSDALGKLRGQVYDFESCKVMVTYHPAALLRDKQRKHDTWEDVKKLRRLYDELVGDKSPVELK